MIIENEITGKIVGAAIEVHRVLGGPGLLESVYEEALVWELSERGLQVERQLAIPISYKEHYLSTPLRLEQRVFCYLENVKRQLKIQGINNKNLCASAPLRLCVKK